MSKLMYWRQYAALAFLGVIALFSWQEKASFPMMILYGLLLVVCLLFIGGYRQLYLIAAAPLIFGMAYFFSGHIFTGIPPGLWIFAIAIFWTTPFIFLASLILDD